MCLLLINSLGGSSNSRLPGDSLILSVALVPPIPIGLRTKDSFVFLCLPVRKATKEYTGRNERVSHRAGLNGTGPGGSRESDGGGEKTRKGSVPGAYTADRAWGSSRCWRNIREHLHSHPDVAICRSCSTEDSWLPALRTKALSAGTCAPTRLWPGFQKDDIRMAGWSS